MPTPAAPTDRLATFFAEPTARRLILLCLFIGTLAALQSLLVFALAGTAMYDLVTSTERALGRLDTRMTPRFLRGASIALLVAAGTALLLAGGGHLLASAQSAWTHLPPLLTLATQSPLWLSLVDRIPAAATIFDSASSYATEHATTGFAAARAIGRGLILALVGMIVSVIYVSEEPRLHRMRDTLAPSSATETLWRWFAYVCDGLRITIRTQVAVAAVNAGLTLPLLALLRMPDLATLTALVFLGSLVPVIGNLLVGALLALIAGALHGLPGVATLVVATFLLHKLESYWINPKLASAHVALPSVVIIASLLIWEHLLGIRGFFVSLPALIVMVRLRQEFVHGVPLIAPTMAFELLDSPAPIPNHVSTDRV